MDKKNRFFWLTAAGASLLSTVAFAESTESVEGTVEAAASANDIGKLVVETPKDEGNGMLIWIICGAVALLVILGIVIKLIRVARKKKMAAEAVAAYKEELDAKRAKARELKNAEEAARLAQAAAEETVEEAAEEAAETVEEAVEEVTEKAEETTQEALDETMERMAAEIEEIKAELPGTEAVAAVEAVLEPAVEPVDEVLSETAHEVIPASIDGKQIYRFFPDVVIDPANYDVSSVQLGQPVSFVTIGKNLFAQSKRKIIGRVTKKSVAEKVAAWQLDKKLLAAVITDADASDGDLKVTIAFYDDLLKVAEEKGAKMIKLSATKNEEAQANIVKAKVGTACRASFDKREDNGKEDRWKVYTADGYVGVLAEDDYYNDGSLRIVVAEVATSKKDNKASMWVYVI